MKVRTASSCVAAVWCTCEEVEAHRQEAEATVAVSGGSGEGGRLERVQHHLLVLRRKPARYVQP